MTERAAKWVRRNKWVAALIAVSSAGLLTLVAVLAWSNYQLARGYQREQRASAEARASAQSALRQAYVSEMRQLDETWDRISSGQAKDLLRRYVPQIGEPDLRGFEWWLYWRIFFDETPSRVVGRHQGGVHSAAMSPGGEVAATGGADGVIRLWNAGGGQLIRELRGHQGNVNGLAFSPDGRRLASAADDKTARAWDVTSGECLSVFRDHLDWVSCVAFLGDGETVASGGADKTIFTWSATYGQQQGSLAGHTDTVRSLAWHARSNTLFSASKDATIRAWDVDRMETSELFPEGMLVTSHPLNTLGAHRWVRQLAIGPDQNGLYGV